MIDEEGADTFFVGGLEDVPALLHGLERGAYLDGEVEDGEGLELRDRIGRVQ